MARKKGKIYLLVLVLFVLFLSGFLLNSLSIFEKNAPQILVEDLIYNNGKDPILIRAKDTQSGIKSVKISLRKDHNASTNVIYDQNMQAQRDLNLQVNLPKLAFKEKTKSYILDIEVSDASFWNFGGNSARKEVVVVFDDKAPAIKILNHSYQIEKGGAASVVFKVDDENLADVFIQTNKDQIFKATKFFKEGYFAALIAWDARDEDFKAYVVAKDKAGNLSEERIRYYLSNRKYRVSNINLNDNFLDGKIQNLAREYAPNNTFTRFENFKFVNETLRISNEDLIRKYTQEVPEESIDDFKLNLFLPLKNSSKVADFADHRFYFYEGKFISDSYHMGLDLASTAKADIITNNNSQVVFAGENGIYGLNLILYHGFGVYTLYGHCSTINVALNEELKAGSIIAKTGVSGLALGDHLHFGVLVQGIETRPEQWQDKKWLENNIYKILNDSKKMILSENK